MAAIADYFSCRPKEFFSAPGAQTFELHQQVKTREKICAIAGLRPVRAVGW